MPSKTRPRLASLIVIALVSASICGLGGLLIFWSSTAKGPQERDLQTVVGTVKDATWTWTRSRRTGSIRGDSCALSLTQADGSSPSFLIAGDLGGPQWACLHLAGVKVELKVYGTHVYSFRALDDKTILRLNYDTAYAYFNDHYLARRWGIVLAAVGGSLILLSFFGFIRLIRLKEQT